MIYGKEIQMSHKISDLNSNQYYYGLNRRFEKRWKLLMQLGFMPISNELGSFLFRVRKENPHKSDCVCCSELSHWHNRVWIDNLTRILRRG